MSEIKTLLVSINNTWRYSNLGVDQLAGFLRQKGNNADIIYSHTGRNFDSVKERLSLSYDIFGFSVNSANFDCCLKAAEYIKQNKSNSIVVFGGRYAGRYYKEVLQKTKFVDYIVLGDGEVPLCDIISNATADRPSLIYHANIASPNSLEGKVPYLNNNVDYFPAFDYWQNDTLERNKRKEYCIQSKNNVCTGSCSFCTEHKGRIAYKDTGHILEEITYISKNFGVRKFFFTDDNLFDPNTLPAKKRIIELCQSIRKLEYKLVFKCYIKANTFKDTSEDKEILALLSEAGFKTMFVGIESGNNADLMLYNKYCTVEDNYCIIELLRAHGIVPQIGFININPYSTTETIRANYEFLTKTKIDNLFMYVCSYLRVFKYTPIYNRMLSDGLLLPEYDYLDDTSLYNLIDQNAQRIFDFIYQYMYKRVRRLDFDFDWLYSYYNECKHLNASIVKVEDELNAIRQKHLIAIKEFFYHLFVKLDFNYCYENADSFLTVFEESQPRLFSIHREIVNCYVQNTN